MLRKNIKTYATYYFLITHSMIQNFYKKLNLKRNLRINTFLLQYFNYKPFKRKNKPFKRKKKLFKRNNTNL